MADNVEISNAKANPAIISTSLLTPPCVYCTLHFYGTTSGYLTFPWHPMICKHSFCVGNTVPPPTVAAITLGNCILT